MEKNRTYIAIDLKSFFASVECADRGLDPLDTNLVVADESRTDKTICLAVTPSLKQYGISGRARLFEVVEQVGKLNEKRRLFATQKTFSGKSHSDKELKANPNLAVSYITASPRMALYMEYSTRIYQIYLKYVAPEDIQVYSIDEVFMDVTDYLKAYNQTPHDLAMTIIRDVLSSTGITATAGIGSNLYLCKVAMDIVAKHIPADRDGVRIAELDEMSYRRLLWNHRPLTDFWRLGRGYAKKLESMGLFTMGDIARYSLENEDRLYQMFGVNAELLIDHAWGYEPCTIADIKSYKPSSNSLSMGQVLQKPYNCEKALLIVREMADMLALSLAEKGLNTNQIVLHLSYDSENFSDPAIKLHYRGEISVDMYGKAVPKSAHGSENLGRHTCSARLISEAAEKLFCRIADEQLLIRKINITACDIISDTAAACEYSSDQPSLFTDCDKQAEENAFFKRERDMQKAILSIKKRFGKNALLKGMNLEEDATTAERNRQIGGHKA